MAKNLSKDDVALWQRRIKLSQDWRRPHEKKWRKYLDYVEGKFFEVVEEEDQIAVNLVHPMVQIIIPAIYSKNPDIIVKPRRKDFIEAARTMEFYLNYLVKEIDLKGEMKLCLLDALVIGHGWIKSGYQTDFDAIQDAVSPVQQIYAKMKAMMGDSEPEESTYSIEPDERIVSERPWALRVSPFDTFVPALSRSEHTLPWIAQRLVREVEDVKSNSNYSKKVRNNIRASANAYQILQGTNLVGAKKVQPIINDPQAELAVLYEVWDCKENCIYVIPDPDSGDSCLEYKENEFTFLPARHTFTMLRFNNITDKFYPLSDIQPWEPQQHELNNIRTQMSRHRKRFNRRYVYTDGDFKPGALEQLKKGEDGALIPTDAEDARKAVAPVQDAALPADVYAIEKSVKEDITNISGITDYQRGSAARGAKTATEASIVENQSRFRTEERLDVVSEFALRIVRNLAMISQHFMDQQQVIPILGDMAIDWLKVDKNQIQGEMLFELVYGSTAPVNRDVEKQQYLQAYELMSQDPLFNPVRVRVEFLRQVLGVRDVNQWMRPDIAAMLEQQEMARIKAQTENPMGTDVEHEEEVTPKMAPGQDNGGPSEGVPTSPTMMAQVRRSLRVRTPGGVGGGRQNR